ncbi:hypothetical protein AQUCO_03400163v1 [Aquilegia coerulea]|uniref:Uncharacterized protein n=1 Tax=Aquilegia coerulea TaxID=218851 RepID=A0A2G5CXS7_AQUCA|nr:hypothetical protein AQUCO_03400163v1 [Aquilegia coerulea]
MLHNCNQCSHPTPITNYRHIINATQCTLVEHQEIFLPDTTLIASMTPNTRHNTTLKLLLQSFFHIKIKIKIKNADEGRKEQPREKVMI